MADESRPYIGYRSAGRRPERNQDRRAAADAPLALLRGWAAGTAGLPGDIEALLRMVTPGVDNTPALPTSDFYKEWLPGAKLTATPVGRAATELGGMTGGLGAGTAARGVERAGRMLGRGALEQVARAVESGNPLVAAAAPAYVVKPKGGNWLAGSVEEALGPLKKRLDPELEGYARRGQNLMPHEAAEVLPGVALNDWIDKQLSRYVRNEMATPEDPVRALAERGVLHFEPGRIDRKAASAARDLVGMEQQGKSRLARNWEDKSDDFVRAYETAAEMLLRPSVVAANPWLSKVAPDASVFRVNPLARDDALGFSHLVDELRNALNPESGLPRELLLKYGSLERLSVPQAVERVAKINEWRAAQKAAADAARANNPAVQLFREYPTVPGTDLPNERGLRWVELKSPANDALPEGYSVSIITNDNLPPGHMGRNSYAVVDPQGRMLENVNPRPTEAEALEQFKQKYGRGALEDALKYEGETMGHCVGGYCPDVLEGRSRIYSLRDAKGEPHVTVEVKPPRDEYPVSGESFVMLPQEVKDRYRAITAEWRKRNPDDPDVWKALAEAGIEPTPPSIVQIKGKGNAAPKEDYLPFVQDFVKSQQWSDIGDLPNTGLRRIGGKYFTDPEIQSAMDAAGFKFPAKELETDYYDRLLNDTARHDASDALFYDALGLKPKTGPEQGFASGGLVEHSDPGYNPDRIDALAAQLRTELFA